MQVNTDNIFFFFFCNSSFYCFHPVHDNIIQNTDYRFIQIMHVRPEYIQWLKLTEMDGILNKERENNNNNNNEINK